MKYKYIQIISLFLVFIFLLNFVSAKDAVVEKSVPEEAKYSQDVFYPSEEVLMKNMGITTEQYIELLKNNAQSNRLTSVPNYWGTCPKTGQVKIPVVLVKFPDNNSTIYTSAQIDGFFNSQIIETNRISVSKYYNMQSYGALDINFVVFDWTFAPNNNYAYYSTPSGEDYLALDIYNYLESLVDFNDYDLDNDERIDGMIIIYPGIGIESDTYGIWPHTKIFKSYTDTVVDGKYFGNVAFIPEKGIRSSNSFEIAITAHEFAHVLGLPDLYATNSNGFNSIGNGPMHQMTLMQFNDSSCLYKPINLDAWSRYYLGWTNPIILTTDSNKQISLRSANDYPDSVILKNDNLNIQEFFIIENRYRNNDLNNLDKCMFSNASTNYGGFAIYHVDENKIGNDFLQNRVQWDGDNNYYNDNTWPGLLFEQTRVKFVNDTPNWTTIESEDLYFYISSNVGRSYFDENMHKTTEPWDMASRSYNGNLNPLIRFQALTGNQQTMIAKMLVGEETANPIANPASGATSNEPIQVTLSTPTAGATIYYTTDGTDPTINSQIYSNPITLSQTTTLKAIAKKDDFYVSDILTANYTVNATVATPIANPDSGEINYLSSVSLSTTTDGANIYYTTDGSDPTEESTLYVSSIIIDHSLTLKVRAYKQNWTPSQIATYNYTVKTTEAPIANPLSGNYLYASTVELSTATENAQIYYTIDGTTPDESSTLYQSPIVIDHNFTLKAIAYRDRYSPSPVSTFNYTTTIPTNRITNFSFEDVQLVNSFKDGNTFYFLIPYDVNRRTLIPIITLEQGCTINPESGIVQDFTRPVRYRVSSVIGYTDYTIVVFNDIHLNPPTSNPPEGAYSSPQSVSLISGMPRSVIRYTTNGQDPLSSPSQIYTTPINVSEETIIKARTYYSPLPISSANIAHSDNIDYQHNLIYLRLFKKEYISELMTKHYTIIREEKSIDENLAKDLIPTDLEATIAD